MILIFSAMVGVVFYPLNTWLRVMPLRLATMPAVLCCFKASKVALTRLWGLEDRLDLASRFLMPATLAMIRVAHLQQHQYLVLRGVVALHLPCICLLLRAIGYLSRGTLKGFTGFQWLFLPISVLP